MESKKLTILVTLNEPEEIKRFNDYKERQKIKPSGTAAYKALLDSIERDEQDAAAHTENVREHATV
jgi:hypothetical protein